METESRIVRDILRQNEILLRRHLVLSKTVLDLLRSEGLLTETAKRKIMLEPNHRQVGVLVQNLEYKGLNSMKKFLDILRQTGHSWLADTLMDTSVGMDKVKPNNDFPNLRYRDTYTSSLLRRYPSQRSSATLSLVHDRNSVTAGGDAMSSSGLGIGERGKTLSNLLRARYEPQEHVQTRGFINTRDLLGVPPTGIPPLYPDISQGGHHRNIVRHPGHLGPLHDLPGTLYDLNQAFASQEQQNQQAMNILQQEETAIRQLLEQNARDQGQVRRKQAAVVDISGRLKDIHERASAVYNPAPHPDMGRYRLSQLNQIPWSM